MPAHPTHRRPTTEGEERKVKRKEGKKNGRMAESEGNRTYNCD
jgi:hypothetical protein